MQVLVLTTSREIDRGQAERMAAYFDQVLPGVRVVVAAGFTSAATMEIPDEPDSSTESADT